MQQVLSLPHFLPDLQTAALAAILVNLYQSPITVAHTPLNVHVTVWLNALDPLILEVSQATENRIPL